MAGTTEGAIKAWETKRGKYSYGVRGVPGSASSSDIRKVDLSKAENQIQFVPSSVPRTETKPLDAFRDVSKVEEWAGKVDSVWNLTQHESRYALSINTAEYLKELKYREDKKKEATTKVAARVAASAVYTRVGPTVLTKVLIDGRFKNQFETNTSKGLKDRGIRRETEGSLFGTPPDLPDYQRPIYGYLSDQPGGMSESSDFTTMYGGEGGRHERLDQYGTISVKLKDSVRDRTTFNVGDSLDLTRGGEFPTLQPQPVSNPSYLAFPTQYIGTELIDKSPHDNYIGYWEAQVHGGLNVSDIDSVTFRNEPPASLKKMLTTMSIPWKTWDDVRHR